MKIVLSGVNLIEGGPLKIYQDAIQSVSKFDVEVICLVNDKKFFSLIEQKNTSFIELKYPKKNWIYRVFFEYVHSYFLCKKLKPDLWFSLHDITPYLPKKTKSFVYCHNPSPFYTPSNIDFKYSKKFYLFSLFYSYLYGINIRNNEAVVCQQSWLADSFKAKYGVDNVIVSYPISNTKFNYEVDNNNEGKCNDKKILFYPTLARTFKNIELIISAVETIPDLSEKLEFVITIDLTQGDYAKSLIERASKFNCFRFTGYLERNEINKLYKSCDAVIFPSKLETWGLPISEAVSFKKPIILADLPYAHETLGSYNQACFIPTNDKNYLANVLKQYVEGEKIFHQVKYEQSNDVIIGWDMLFKKLINFVRK